MGMNFSLQQPIPEPVEKKTVLMREIEVDHFTGKRSSWQRCIHWYRKMRLKEIPASR